MQVRSTFGAAGLGDIRWLGISNEVFYFARYGQPGAIWQVSLGGGPVGLFANLGPDWGYQIEPPLVQSPEGLLLNGERRIDSRAGRPATILIAADGAVRDLPYPEGTTSRPFLTPSGVVHNVNAPNTGSTSEDEAGSGDEAAPTDDAELEGTAAAPDDAAMAADEAEPLAPVQMWLTRLRGGEQTVFWPDRPEEALPDHVESDGRGGWFVTANEPFNDGFRHDTLWHVRPNAPSRRLACNPSPESFQIQTESRTGHAFAAGDGFVYVVALRGQSAFWELVKVSYLINEGDG
jgi:hypothetical protein